MVRQFLIFLIGSGVLLADLGNKKTVNVSAGLRYWTPIFTEDFENGIPSTWDIIDGNGDEYTWTDGTTDELVGYEPPNYGERYAYYDDNDPSLDPGEELISPSVDASSYSQVKIKYAWGFKKGGWYSSDWYKVEYSIDGGVTWNLICQYYGEGSGWDSIIISGTYSDIKIRFVYYETDLVLGGACAVDNVSIEGWQVAYDDVGVVAISPHGSGSAGAQEVMVTVKNFGINDEVNVPVYVNIDGILFNSPQYVDVDSGSITNVSFGNYEFTENTHTITAYTALVGDECSDNDTMVVEYTATWWIQYDNGVAATFVEASFDNWGMGMRFDVPAGIQVDSVFVGLGNYPDYEEKPLVLAVYGDAGGQPDASNLLWVKDTALLAPPVFPYWYGFVIYSNNFCVGSNTSIYYFWIDVNSLDGQGLVRDYSRSMPLEYYWEIQNYPNPSFSQDVPHGDWFLRIHINGDGLNEWLPYNPHKEVYFSIKPNVVKGDKVEIKLFTSEKNKVKVQIFNTTGRLIVTLYKGIINGEKVIIWNTSNIKAGTYFIKVSTPYNLKSSKIIVVK